MHSRGDARNARNTTQEGVDLSSGRGRLTAALAMVKICLENYEARPLYPPILSDKLSDFASNGGWVADPSPRQTFKQNLPMVHKTLELIRATDPNSLPPEAFPSLLLQVKITVAACYDEVSSYDWSKNRSPEYSAKTMVSNIANPLETTSKIIQSMHESASTKHMKCLDLLNELKTLENNFAQSGNFAEYTKSLGNICSHYKEDEFPSLQFYLQTNRARNRIVFEAVEVSSNLSTAANIENIKDILGSLAFLRNSTNVTILLGFPMVSYQTERATASLNQSILRAGSYPFNDLVLPGPSESTEIRLLERVRSLENLKMEIDKELKDIHPYLALRSEDPAFFSLSDAAKVSLDTFRRKSDKLLSVQPIVVADIQATNSRLAELKRIRLDEEGRQAKEAAQRKAEADHARYLVENRYSILVGETVSGIQNLYVMRKAYAETTAPIYMKKYTEKRAEIFQSIVQKLRKDEVNFWNDVRKNLERFTDFLPAIEGNMIQADINSLRNDFQARKGKP
jgi:hypothetical protein